MQIKLLGKVVKTTDVKLLKKLDISQDELDDLKENKTRYLVNNKTGDVVKINISDSPLLLREFGVKRINNKIYTGGNIKKGISVFKEPIDLEKIKVSGNINVLLDVVWVSSGRVWKDRFLSIEVNKKILKDQLEVENMVIELFLKQNPQVQADVFARLAEIQNVRLDFKSKNSSLKFDDMKLRSNDVLDITKIFGENIQLNKSKNNSCVKDYLKNNYKISTKKIDKLGDENGVSPFEIYNFCKDYCIKMILFNIEGDIIMSNYPIKVNKTYKKLIGLVYNNHFYPIKNEELHRLPNRKPNKNILCNDMNSKLNELLSKNIYPTDLMLYNDKISTIQVDDIIYHSNKDYEFCKNVLSKFGLKDKMEVHINEINISNVIEKIFIKSNIESFFPYNSNEGGFTYVNDAFIDDDNDFITIDHNKHYSDALRKLKKLIVVDIKQAKHIMNPELQEGYLYIAKPKYSSILMPKTGFYSYEFLKYCKEENVEFTLQEAVSCEYKPNYFTEMINTMYDKLSNDEFKGIINCMIGKFEKKSDMKKTIVYKKIANEDETSRSGGFVMKVNDKYNIVYDIENKVNTKIYNRVPIRVQLLCEARKIVYEKMKAEGIKEVKQIRCDAITYKPNKKFRGGYEMGDWKEQEPTLFQSSIDVVDHEMTFNLKPINPKNTIYIDYAGSGKTHFIINKLLVGLDNFIVLSPSHASIRDYRTKKINCNVINH